MLQIFKKTGRTVNCDDKTPDDLKGSFEASTTICSFFEIENESNLEDTDDFIDSYSRLSMNLVDVIKDKSCLSYFVQFLETKKALSLIKFYLDAESFKTAAELSRTMSSLHDGVITNKCSLHSHKDENKNLSDNISYTSFDICDRMSICSQVEHNLGVSSNKIDEITNDLTDHSKMIETVDVPDLKAVFDLSVSKALTDDEKCQLFSKTMNVNEKTDSYIKAEHNDYSQKSATAIATDAIRIYRKYLTVNSPHHIDIPAVILSNISLALCSHESGKFDTFSITSSCFEEAQRYILEKLEKDFFNEFLESSFYCKYCVDILTSPDLKLSDILHSEAALFYFMEYLEQEKQQNCLEFWIAATNFRKHYEARILEDDKEEATNDAMILYEKYFSLQAPYPLRIPDRIRSRVEECICSEGDSVSKCFDLPLKIIEKHLELNYFAKFLSSQLFANYLNDLKSKIKDHKTPEWKSSLRKHRCRKTRSDSTLEINHEAKNYVLPQQNTLLAMERSKTKNNKSSSSDMHIDPRQLTDPDLLWHRNSAKGLSFGRIDSLGRYERDFDVGCTEERWTLTTSGNKIKNAVRKLVNLPEDRVQEEIAWQVAEMIVKDITSITLGNVEDCSG